MSTEKTAVQFLQIDAERAGQRIDNFLLALMGRPPKSRIYKMLRKGEVRVNKGRIKPDYRLAAGDVVRVPPYDAPKAGQVSVGEGRLAQIEAAVIEDNRDFLVVNKPSGLAVHGGSGLNYGLIEALRLIYPQQRSLELVHRLDRDTSGCILVAKKRSALREMHRLLREDGMNKIYLALVAGRWPSRKQVVNAPLKKNELQSGERMVRVREDGKPSLTEFRVMERFAGVTLMQAKPVTGRTHQIRVHAQYAGFPLVGDPKYGLDEVNAEMKERGIRRLFLHAAELAFPWDGAQFSISAPLEPKLVDALQALRTALAQDSGGG